MGMLEDLLGGAMGGQPGMGQRDARQAASGGGMSGTLMALLPIVLSMLSNRGGGSQQSGYGASGGGLQDILGQMMGGGAQRGGGGLGDVLGGMLGGGAAGGGRAGGGLGGLDGLLQQMTRAGYGEQAQSWVGTGQNMPIGPEALEQIFGRGGIGAIARQAGVSEADASQGLSALLPEVVDRITPGGEVPDFDSLDANVGDLSRRFGLGP